MNAFICDRCGAYFSNNDDLKYSPTCRLDIYDKEERQFFIADLCSSCYKKLEEWVESANEDELPFY